MFKDINAEHVAVYAKLEPLIAEFRRMPGMPPFFYLKNIEPPVTRMPGAQERIAMMRRFMKDRAEASVATSRLN